MHATTRINAANNFANCNNRKESNFGSVKSSSNNNAYKRIPTVETATTTTKTIALSYCNNNTNNNLPLQQTASNGKAAGEPQKQQRQRSPAPAETATSRECCSVACSTLTTMRLVGAKESGAVMAGNDEEARTKLMPATATAIKIVSVSNSKSNNSNTKAHKNVSSNNKNSNNINKSTTKSTGTTGAKLDSSMLINARNQLSTTTTKPERRQQQEQMGQQQAEHILSITRDLNQINLKSSLFVEQQVYNNNNNNNKQNCRGNNQQEQQQQNSLSTNLSSGNNNSSGNNKHSNVGNNNNNRQNQQQQIVNCNNNSNNKNCDQAIDKNKNSKNTHTLAHNNRRMMKNYENNNNNKGSNEPQPQQQQQLITLTIAKAVQTEANALVSAKISKTTKVNTTTTTTATPTTTIERAKAKSTKLTLRKSFSTPASFKIADVTAVLSQSGGNMMIAYNNTNNSRASESCNKSVSNALPTSELLSGKKSDSGGDVVDDGGGHVRGAATCTTTQPTTQSAVAAPNVNFAPSPAVITKATQRANASIEAITTIAKTAMTTKTSATTPISASPQIATMDAVTRSQTAAHAAQQQDPPQQRQLQQQQQLQQQYQQSSTKSVKSKDNDNQVICANKSISDAGNMVVVAGTTTTSSPLPLSPVSFDLDLRFGCAHYKRRAMFVTPCCNKFYKCRFCHDENESHHFDRKTLTELICSECNTRQKVQEQCEACGMRFGKYTCLICNLFDDTDKKQYHCNGCGICRIGGAENFFHCKVCDMCLPIRLKIDGHRCVENISRSHCPVCLGDIHTSRIPCHIPDCGHLLHKTCFDQLLNSGHYTCPICQTSLIDMTALWEYLDAQAVSLPVPKKYENQRIHIFCNDCHKTSKTKFNFIGLKCMQCGAYNTTQDVKRRMSLVTDEPSSA
uniref:RING finger and CHY zinc finger domain-containing protein 1 n=1 Tax=Bactrocera latifrons TaxID=174628 RepID=A0A0K8VXU1_BACLA